MIISDTPKNRKLFKKAVLKKWNRQWQIKNGLTFIDSIVINMYGPNKVMFVVAAETETFGLTIFSYYLYETLMSIFNFLWEKK